MEVMKALRAEEMRRIDEAAIKDFGIPGEVLMAFAGRVVANYIIDEFPLISRIAVICGFGNNGGDGFVVAYLLSNSGRSVRVYFAGKEEKLSGTAWIYYSLCKKTGVPIDVFDDEQAGKELAQAELIVDALAGTGFSGTPRGAMARAISAINRCDAIVLSIDVPSGLPSDGDAPEGEAVFADITVTIGLPKISLVTYPGKQWTGKLVLADIGFPRNLTESNELTAEIVDAGYFNARYPAFCTPDVHKYQRGNVLFVGGFDGMEGALLLAASAFFETGAGIATALTTAEARKIIAGKLPELITLSLEQLEGFQELVRDCAGTIDPGIEKYLPRASVLFNAFFKMRKQYDVVVVGPGMGRDTLSRVLVHALLDGRKEWNVSRIIIDGDGLFHFADYIKSGKKGGSDILITPHFLEASRITGEPVDRLKANRFASASKLASVSASVALLKGPATIISDGVSHRINTTGNPALATAGSGDVLSGIIASLVAKGLPLLDAAALGAWIHGRAADIFVQESKKDAMKASDIIAHIGAAMRRIDDK